jgi:adenylate cyclase
MTFWKRLKEGKLVQWALAYLAGAWVLLQLTSVLGGMYDLPRTLVRAVPVLLAVGFLAALVLAWYHGEKGRQRVSGPELLMLGALLLIAGAAVAWVGGGAESPVAAAEPPGAAEAAVDARSLAVLPFADLSEAGDQKWFAEGLAEEILTSLSRLPELRVIGRSSSFLFTAGATDDRVIAGTLGVAHLVKGSVRRVGDRIRATAQLVRTADGVQLWSEAYDRDAADLLDVQRDVAEKVAAALDIFLDDTRREKMFAAGTRDVEAFETFLRGRAIFAAAHLGERGLTLADANPWFERAMACDPGFAAPAFLHADRYGHFVVDGPASPVVGPHELSLHQAHERLRRDFEHVARGRDPHMRLIAQINHAFFSEDWRGLPRLLDALEPHAATLVVDDPWGRHVPIVLGRIELARTLSEGMTRWDRLSGIGWTQRIQVELAAGDIAAAHALIAEARGVLPQVPWFDLPELIAFILAGDREGALARVRDLEEWTGYAAAVRGDAATARARAAAFDAAQEWPDTRLLRVYHELDDRERSRELAARIDALPAGPAMLLRELSLIGAALTFDPADTPNFTARMREAGVDPASLRVMPRLNVMAGGTK